MSSQSESTTAAERAMHIFESHGGILSTGQALGFGIHPRTLYQLRDHSALERLERGLYRLASAPPLEDPDLITVALKVPRGVICLISALAFHQMTSQVPHSVYVAIPANDQAPRLNYHPLRLFWYSTAIHENGVTEQQIDDIKVRIYSPEKTLADCFKFRNKVGIDVCIEALQFYRQRGRMRLDEIERYAKLCRVQKVMRPYIEAIA